VIDLEVGPAGHRVSAPAKFSKAITGRRLAVGGEKNILLINLYVGRSAMKDHALARQRRILGVRTSMGQHRMSNCAVPFIEHRGTTRRDFFRSFDDRAILAFQCVTH